MRLISQAEASSPVIAGPLVCDSWGADEGIDHRVGKLGPDQQPDGFGRPLLGPDGQLGAADAGQRVQHATQGDRRRHQGQQREE
ncbi:MAG: hypothetical protein QOE53_1852 [Pseudonocardiales bacterium]|jgi:hypothetical protein|nr:hypothetical protein [Pseudonocardiales bacterium]